MNLPPRLTAAVRRFPVAWICGALVLVVLVAFAYRFGRLGEVDEQLKSNQSESDSIRRNIHNARELEAHLASLKEGVASLEKRLVRADDILTNKQYFYKVETESGAKITKLLPLISGPSAPKAAAAGSYRPVGFNVIVEGTFPKVVAFVAALETGNRHYRLTGFSVQRGSSTVEQADAPKGETVLLNLSIELLGSK